MATITLNQETPEYVYGDGASVDLNYDVIGLTDATAVGALGWSTAPTTYYHGLEILVRQRMEIRPVGYDVWKVRVHYGRFPFGGGESPLLPAAAGGGTGPVSINDRLVRYATTAGTMHVTHSRATVASYALPGKTATNHNQAVEVDAVDGTVRGTDIFVPVSRMIERWTLPTSQFDEFYVDMVEDMVTCQNVVGWRRYNAGEVLLVNFEAERSHYEKWTLTFEFAIQKNRANITIGGLTVLAKLGWDQLWVKYRSKKDAASGVMGQEAYEAYVEQHYESANFALLGLGT